MHNDKLVFKKYYYWMESNAVDKLKSKLEEEKKSYHLAVKLPCEALKERISIVAPEVWNLNCKHDAAPWYYASELNGKYLVVTDEKLAFEFEQYFEASITESNFQPQTYPLREEIKALAESKKYKSMEPEGWCGFPPEMAEKLSAAFKNNIGIPESIEDIFEIWSAIHANFIEGKIAIEANGERIPYTIADTNHTGSCCVELFNILGKEFKTKLVKPCLGAKILKALEADRYYRVESIR